jgi:hypothetical protein
MPVGDLCPAAAAHCKSSMFGAGLTIPITKGRLNLGTWQVSTTHICVNTSAGIFGLSVYTPNYSSLYH